MSLPYTAPWLLAPMEGVTEPLFRGMVLGLHAPEDLGGACTEFVRVSSSALPRRVLRAHLGVQGPIPVALQLMGSDLAHLATTAARAVEVGAPVLDLNFGCPAKGALRGCAGSALMDDPERLRELVAATCEAVAGRVPVTAKLRAGGDDDSRLEELVDAACVGGAALVTMHARTRAEAYSVDADWARLRRAADAARAHGVPVCGNGGVERHADLEALRRQTGCAYAMVGRGALADPWIFSGHEASRAEAAGFLVAYGRGLEAQGVSTRGAAARVKQLLGHWRAGGLVPDDEARRGWLREGDPQALLARLEACIPRGGDLARGGDVPRSDDIARSGDLPHASAPAGTSPEREG